MACNGNKSTKAQEIPNHIMVGRVIIPLDGMKKGEVTYQGWLSMSRSKYWGNVNVAIDPVTRRYDAWLDYGDLHTEKTKRFSGKLPVLKQRELNEIGSRILKAYPYKETMRDVVASQKPRRR